MFDNFIHSVIGEYLVDSNVKTTAVAVIAEKKEMMEEEDDAYDFDDVITPYKDPSGRQSHLQLDYESYAGNQIPFDNDLFTTPTKTLGVFLHFIYLL